MVTKKEIKIIKLTAEEVNFAIIEMEFLFASQWHNGDFEKFAECTDNSKESFDKQVILIKSIMKKLKNN